MANENWNDTDDFGFGDIDFNFDDTDDDSDDDLELGDTPSSDDDDDSLFGDDFSFGDIDSLGDDSDSSGGFGDLLSDDSDDSDGSDDEGILFGDEDDLDEDEDDLDDEESDGDDEDTLFGDEDDSDDDNSGSDDDLFGDVTGGFGHSFSDDDTLDNDDEPELDEDDLDSDDLSNDDTDIDDELSDIDAELASLDAEIDSLGDSDDTLPDLEGFNISNMSPEELDELNEEEIDFGSLDDDDEEDNEELDEEDDELEEETDGDVESDNPEDFEEGALIDSSDLLDDDDDDMEDDSTDFISDSGGIVVQDATDTGNGFDFAYIPIDKIAITSRIRKPETIDSLVQSVRSTGLLQPLTVAPTATEGIYVLLDGFRRIQACAKLGKDKIPCIINNKVSTPEIPIIEAMYNHNRQYKIQERIDYIKFIETQKGILQPTLIEFLLQMNNGDYSKLKDILTDNDEEIVDKLLSGEYDIATAFKKLEQRRKKESAAEKENKQISQVYSDAEKSGIAQVEGSGEDVEGGELSQEQIDALNQSIHNVDEDIEDKSIAEMTEESNAIEGFEPNQQKVGERERIDPAIRKAVMARDNFTCACCKRGGEQYVDILDCHHVLPVFVGGKDEVDNCIMLCVSCHRLVHLFSTGDLSIPKALHGKFDDLDDSQKERYPNEEVFNDEVDRFKRIIRYGDHIRKAAAQQGLNRKAMKKDHPNDGIGRRKPGKNAPQEYA